MIFCYAMESENSTFDALWGCLEQRLDSVKEIKYLLKY